MAETQTAVTSDSKLFGALCYIINFWVPLFVMVTDKKNDKFALFHAYHALLFLVAWIVLMIATFGLSLVLSIVDPTGMVSCLLSIINLGVYGILILFALFMAFKAWSGEKFKLPVIGDMAEGYAK